MKKKLVSLMLSTAMIASLVAGCGSSQGGSATTEAPSTESAPAEETKEEAKEETTEETTEAASTEETTEAASSDDGRPEVTVWHYFEHEAEALNKVADEYNASQDKIKVTCTFVSREELMNQYTIGAVSGELPDIGMVDSPDMSSYIALGVFEDITDELDAWGELDKFYPGPLSSCKDADGKIYGLPNNSNCLALLCNMDILSAHGYDAPPTTWDEFYEVAKACTDSADSVYGFAMSAISNEEGTFQFIPWLYSAGADVSSLDSAEAIHSIDFLGNLVKEGIMSKEVINWTQGDALNAFAAGKAAMLESGTWQISQIDSGDVTLSTDNYKFALLPKDKKNASVIGGENFGVCSGTEYKEECIDFLKYMMTAEHNADWCEIAGKLAVRSDAATLKDFWTADERYAVFNDSMNYAVARGPHPEWPTISEAIYTAEQSVLIGESDAETAMKGAAEKVAPILEANPIAQ